MKLNRREFVFGAAAIAALPLVGISLPARASFVEVGDVVDFLYFEDWSRPFHPHGPLFVAAIGDWNGSAYPISLMRCGWREEDRAYCDGLDTEWSMFRKELPQKWCLHSPEFANAHSLVRHIRYGESPEVMRDAMEANRVKGPVAGRGYIQLRKTVWA